MVLQKLCPSCRAQVQAWQRFCHACGRQLYNWRGLPPGPSTAAPYACPQCAVAVFAGQRVCAYCGLGLSAANIASWQAARVQQTTRLAPPAGGTYPPAYAPAAPGQLAASQSYYAPPAVQNNYSYQQVVVYAPKSVGLAVLLAFLFGPLGMLYSTVAGALIMLLIAMPLLCVTGGLGIFLLWPACMIWAAVAADSSKRAPVRSWR